MSYPHTFGHIVNYIRLTLGHTLDLFCSCTCDTIVLRKETAKNLNSHCLFQVNANGLSCTEHVKRSIQWADAMVMVYSVTDGHSFDLISQLHQLVSHVYTDRPAPTIILLANKADMVHVRRVDVQQGPALALALGCSFYEVSASEDYSQVHGAFHRLCTELAKRQVPLRTNANAASTTNEKKRSPLIPRPKSPNMQDLKRRFKQVLSAKVRTVTSV